MKFFKSNSKLVFYINNKKLMDFLFFRFVFFSFPFHTLYQFHQIELINQIKTYSNLSLNFKLNLKHFFIIEEKNVIKVCRS